MMHARLKSVLKKHCKFAFCFLIFCVCQFCGSSHDIGKLCLTSASRSYFWASCPVLSLDDKGPEKFMKMTTGD